MRAVRFDDGEVHVFEAPPPVPAAGEVVVRVRSAGICGSDLAMLVAGELADGTPVAIEPLAPCGHCELCRTGRYQVCRGGTGIIYGVGRNGGMAEQICVPTRSLVALPRSVDVHAAALVEPLAVAVHGMRRASVAPGMRVAVVGGGPIGLCAVAAATSTGCEVGLSARHAAQSAAGRALGAAAIEGEYDVAIDCAGTDSAIEQACEALRPNGTLLLLSASWDAFRLPGLALAAKELAITVSTMYGRSASGRDIDAAATLLGEREDLGELLISHRFPLDAAPEAFRAATRRAEGALKVVLEP